MVWNKDSAFTQYNRDNGADSGMIDPDLIGNTSQSTGHAVGNENNYDNNDDEYDDEDDEDEDYQGEEMEEDPADGTAIFSQPVGLGSKVPQTPQRKQTNNQQNNIGASAQRQRRQQQQKQQQQQQQQEQQQQRAHAAVEKRYRSVVNSKIRQLSALIPESNAFNPSDLNAPLEDQGAGAMQKVPTKSVVLERAIQYINHLVSSYEQTETERDKLRRKLQLWLDDTSPQNMPETINV